MLIDEKYREIRTRVIALKPSLSFSKSMGSSASRKRRHTGRYAEPQYPSAYGRPMSQYGTEPSYPAAQFGGQPRPAGMYQPQPPSGYVQERAYAAQYQQPMPGGGQQRLVSEQQPVSSSMFQERYESTGGGRGSYGYASEQPQRYEEPYVTRRYVSTPTRTEEAWRPMSSGYGAGGTTTRTEQAVWSPADVQQQPTRSTMMRSSGGTASEQQQQLQPMSGRSAGTRGGQGEQEMGEIIGEGEVFYESFEIRTPPHQQAQQM